jgi:hypothetical protein
MSDEMTEAAPLQFTPEGAAHESTVAGDINPGLWRKVHGATIAMAGRRDKSYGFDVSSFQTRGFTYGTGWEVAVRLAGKKSLAALRFITESTRVRNGANNGNFDFVSGFDANKLVLRLVSGNE